MTQRKSWQAEVARRLCEVNLRPTRQRVALGKLLFRDHCHVTPETLYREVIDSGAVLSLATVYNTLHQFTEAGLLLHRAVDTDTSYFDTNTEPHQHLYIEDDHLLIDIPDNEIRIARIPSLPVNTEIERVDVVIRLRRIMKSQ